MNSFTLLFAFVSFIIFGYLSLGRILYKHFFPNKPNNKLVYDKAILFTILAQLGYGTFFYSIPAISIALYWGWVPGLLWLFIAHIFIDFLFNIQLSIAPNNNANLGITFYSHSYDDTPEKTIIVRCLLQCYVLLITAITLTYTTKLLDINSGVILFLIMLIPAQAIFNKHSNAYNLAVLSIISLLLLCLGLTLSQHIGLVFHGSWSPFNQAMPWLNINHATLNAAIIIAMAYHLANHKTFRQDMGTLSGALICFLLSVLIIKIIWLRPILDAPTQSHSEPELTMPWFIGLCLFLLSSATGTVLRLFIPHHNKQPPETPLNKQSRFLCYQISSLLSVLILVCLFSILAAAIGIGAWDTHFSTWSTQQNLIHHWQLVFNSIQALMSSHGNLIDTLTISALACLGFCGIIFMLSIMHQLTQNKSDDSPAAIAAVTSMYSHSNIRLITLFLLSALFIHYGVSLTLWLMLGIISWLLLCVFICRATICHGQPSVILSFFSLTLVALGGLQLVSLTIYWVYVQHHILALLTVFLFVISVFLLWQDCQKIIHQLLRHKEDKLFE